MRTVSPAQDLTGIEEMGAGELGPPPGVRVALGELANAAKEGLLALSAGVGPGVLHELMETARQSRGEYRGWPATPPAALKSGPAREHVGAEKRHDSHGKPECDCWDTGSKSRGILASRYGEQAGVTDDSQARPDRPLVKPREHQRGKASGGEHAAEGNRRIPLVAWS
jgi:hypothetical protein